MRCTLVLLVFLALGFLLAGAACGADIDWHFSMAYDAQAKGPVLTAEGLKVVYEGEDYSGSANGSVTISAGGMSSSKMGSLTVDAKNGVATVAFRGKSFKLSDGAKSIEVGGKTYALTAGSDTTVTFAKDGTAKVAEAKASK